MELKKYGIWLLISIFLLLQLLDLLRTHPPWWDAAVYIGMAKYMFSFGQLGLWEEFRPLIWPLMLGFFWKLGFNIFFIGYLLQILFTTGTIYLTYKISKKYMSWELALLAAFFVAFNATFFFFWTKLYTEIPAIFFSLLTVFLFIEKRFLLAVAFLTKFPQGIVFAVLFFILIFNKKIKNSLNMAALFLITLLPFFIFNFIFYRNPIHTLISAKEIIKHAGLWVFQSPWYFYIINSLKENIFFLFAVPGAILLFKKDKSNALLWISISLFVYFSNLLHKEMRFAILFIPFIAIFAAQGLSKYIKKRNAVFVFIILFVLFQFYIMLPKEPLDDWNRIKEFVTYPIEEKAGEILTSHPLINIYTNKVVRPIYYNGKLLEFNEDLMEFWKGYIKKNEVGYVFFDTCEGGTLCNPDDPNCEKSKKEFIGFLKGYKIVYNKKEGRCEYFIFSLQ